MTSPIPSVRTSALAPGLEDARRCERIVRSHARTFALASYFLPPAKRRAAFALYAFCRVADDMVDAADHGDRAQTARRLAEYGRRLDAALEGAPSDAIFRELAWTVREFDVPRAVLLELLDGVGRDLQPARYATWDELSRYCEGVASSVGEMCTHVFGVPDGSAARERALRHARTLGVAMQLTNVLRDVGEDARRGRVYLPAEDLDRFGIDAGDVLASRVRPTSDAWRSLMIFEIDRARTLYDLAMPGITLLASDAQRCASACAVGYAGILDAIEDIGYDVFATRARLSSWARASLLWGIWRGRTVLPEAIRGDALAGWDDDARPVANDLLEPA